MTENKCVVLISAAIIAVLLAPGGDLAFAGTAGEPYHRARTRDTDQSPERKRRVHPPRAGAWGSVR
jgi:hypothetical protein